MPREARKRSEGGSYHIVVQGKRRQHIFGKDEEKLLYLETVLKYRDKTDVQLYAYCILDNHAHLVLKETAEESVSSFMRRVGVSYAYWYRQRHPEIEGGAEIFRGRYLSEPLENESRLLEVVRYVHQEPILAGLAEHMEEYRWSSYRLYLRPGSYLDTRLILDSLHFSGGYENYMQEKQDEQPDVLEEIPLRFGRSDDEAAAIVETRLGGLPAYHLALVDETTRFEILKTLRFKDQISIQQLSRVTGVSRAYIQRLDSN